VGVGIAEWYLDALLDVYAADKEAEDVTAEAGYVFEEDDAVEDCNGEMHDHTPNSDPTQKGKIRYPMRIDDYSGTKSVSMHAPVVPPDDSSGDMEGKSTIENFNQNVSFTSLPQQRE
jgi:hypothetical protein